MTRSRGCRLASGTLCHTLSSGALLDSSWAAGFDEKSLDGGTDTAMVNLLFRGI